MPNEPTASRSSLTSTPARALRESSFTTLRPIVSWLRMNVVISIDSLAALISLMSDLKASTPVGCISVRLPFEITPKVDELIVPVSFGRAMFKGLLLRVSREIFRPPKIRYRGTPRGGTNQMTNSQATVALGRLFSRMSRAIKTNANPNPR